MPRHEKVNINRKMGRLVEKVASVPLYSLHSFPLHSVLLACFIFPSTSRPVLVLGFRVDVNPKP
jgi:hypothetical protein